MTDQELLKKKGITESQLAEQLESFKTGFPFLRLKAAAGIGNGILKPTEKDEQAYMKAWDDYLAGSHRITKFVPASGAASRMFKDVFAFVDAPYDATHSRLKIWNSIQ